MLHIERAIIVEGVYDRKRVGEVCDACCFETDGFKIFRDREKRELIRLLARERGLIVLTDSDRAGLMIRSCVHNITGGNGVVNAYIPEIYGKERRKDKPSAEGKLGVEGMNREALTEVLRPFASEAGLVGEKVTKTDFYEMGLSGADGSRKRRERVCASLKIPVSLSANAMLDAVNAIMTKKQFAELLNSLNL